MVLCHRVRSPRRPKIKAPAPPESMSPTCWRSPRAAQQPRHRRRACARPGAAWHGRRKPIENRTPDQIWYMVARSQQQAVPPSTRSQDPTGSFGTGVAAEQPQTGPESNRGASRTRPDWTGPAPGTGHAGPDQLGSRSGPNRGPDRNWIVSAIARTGLCGFFDRPARLDRIEPDRLRACPWDI